MSKEFKRKYMHPTRRKLVDMIHTGKYEKNATIGYESKKEERKVGDVWEDEHHRYEKKDGFIVKTGKNHQAMQDIRNYLEEKAKCKNPDCKTAKRTKKDKQFIERGGYCMNCTIDREHELRVKGIFKEYSDYKVFTRMLIFGKAKLDELKGSLDGLKEEYEMINDQGEITETWKLPKPIEEVRADIQEMIDSGSMELNQLEKERNEVFDKIKEAKMEHYL